MKNYFKRDLVEICDIEIVNEVPESEVAEICYTESYIG